jgi:hypothetical protein
MKKILLFSILIGLFNCNDFLDTWDGYVIKKGDHYSRRSGMPRRLISLQDGRHIKFQTRFTSSCLYEPYYDDINKLYGFTDCNSSIHENSVRFGWRHDGKGNIEIFAYWYVDGKRGFQKMGETQINIPDEYEIWSKGNEYYFRFNNNEFTTPRTKDCIHGIRARCFPYFGGDASAPQEITIFIYEFS